MGEVVIDPLIQALSDADAKVRAKVAEVLGKIGDKKAIEPLVRVLKKDENYIVQTRVVWALGNIGGPAIEMLVRISKDVDSNIRAKILEVIGRFGGRTAIDSMIAALRDPDFDVRIKAAWMLVRIGEPSLPALIQTLRDPDVNIRAKAAEILGKIANKRATYPLIQTLKDSDITVCEKAIEALGKIADPKAVDPLIEALETHDPGIQAYAAEALGKISDQRAVDPLLQLIKNDNPKVRAKAAEALGRIGNKRCTYGLIRLLNDSDSSVKAKALEALGVIGDTKGAGLSTLIKCPQCNRLTRRVKVSKASNTSKRNPWIMIIVGFILTPFIIGIPVVIYGFYLKIKKKYFWVCEHCKHQFEISWYE
jgi:HEAT repeat protein